VAEAGYAGYEAVSSQGIFAPAGTPAAVIRKLNLEIARIIKQPDVRERWTEMGIEHTANTSEEFESWLAIQGEEMGKLIRANNIKP